MERRLTTILAADVVGYSRLMGLDEAETLAALKRHRRELIEPKAAQYRGRTIKLMGDGALMEFASVVDAVSFAVEAQCAMRERNAEVAEERQITFRIGINVGDIIVEGDDIYGDGVNVAARLESLAEPGGICVRRNVRNQVRDKLDLDFEDLGDIEVKNIARPLRAFKVVLNEKAERLLTPCLTQPRRHRWPWAAAAVASLVVLLGGLLWWEPWAPELVAVDEMALPLPNKPSIAVLPFDNLTNDVSEDYFADGITEDIISTISRIPDVFVIARNSTFTYKGKPVKVQAVARDLGVRYVLEGSVRRVDERVRITAQLIDAVSGSHLWAERYDREITDIFAVQDEIALKVADAMYAKLASRRGDKTRVRERTTDSFEAWDLHIRADTIYRVLTRENLLQARRLWREATEVDPEYAAAWAGLGWTHLLEMRTGWSDAPKQSYQQAKEYTERALSIDEGLPTAHLAMAILSLYAKRHDAAIEEAKRAIAIDPNNATAIYGLGDIMRYSGNFEEAVELIEKAMRLNPYFPEWYQYTLGVCLYHLGRYQESIETFTEVLRRNPSYSWANAGLAYNYFALGQTEKAEAAAKRELEINPSISLDWVRKFVPYKEPSHLAQIVDPLAAVGIPD